jgi:heat shock protein HslJ
MQSNSRFTIRPLILPVGLSVLVLLVAVACAPAATPAPTNSLTGIVWQWTTVTDQGKTTTVPNPENYTIIFNTDGTLNGKADCNTFNGVYSQQNGFTIKLGASTMAYCGDASLDLQYTQLLSNVAAGGPDGAGGLALETAGGAQRMLFKNGGAAPKQ